MSKYIQHLQCLMNVRLLNKDIFGIVISENEMKQIVFIGNSIANELSTNQNYLLATNKQKTLYSLLFQFTT